MRRTHSTLRHTSYMYMCKYKSESREARAQRQTRPGQRASLTETPRSVPGLASQVTRTLGGDHGAPRGRRLPRVTGRDAPPCSPSPVAGRAPCGVEGAPLEWGVPSRQVPPSRVAGRLEEGVVAEGGRSCRTGVPAAKPASSGSCVGAVRVR